MHLLFLTENFPPESNAPAVRTFAHCREWVKAGHEVTVITCNPNFPQGRLHPGYKNKPVSSEVIEGIRVIRVWTYIAANRGFIRRIFDQLSYLISASLAALGVRHVDVVIGTSPQLFAVCAARFAAKIKRIPFIFELRDLWPASIKAVGALSDGFAYQQLVRLESYLYARADRIVAVTEAQRDHLISRGIGKDKVSVVTNGADLTTFHPKSPDPELKQTLKLQGQFVVGYIGTVGMAHNLNTILEAASDPAITNSGKDFHFLFVGGGARKEDLISQTKALGLTNVTFVGMQPQDKISDYYALLDAAVIHLRDADEFRRVLPSKLFECMAMGVPILHGVHGHSAEIIQSLDCGVVFEPENSSDLTKALLALADDQNRMAELRVNCLLGAQSFDRKQLAGNMLAIIEALVEQGASPRASAGTASQSDQRDSDIEY